jgi:hypothetical protein
MNRGERPKGRFVEGKMVREAGRLRQESAEARQTKKKRKKRKEKKADSFREIFRISLNMAGPERPGIIVLNKYPASRAQFAANEIQAQWQGYLPVVKLTEETARFGLLCWMRFVRASVSLIDARLYAIYTYVLRPR